MGMFDTIIVKNAKDVLPISDEMRKLSPEVLDRLLESFQTKDIDPIMDTYVIDDGRLYLVDGLGWSYKPELNTLSTRQVDWTGVMTFYTYIDDVGTEVPQNAWLEYRAKFYSGELQSVVLHEFKLTQTDPATLAAQEKWSADLFNTEARLKAKWYNRYLPAKFRAWLATNVLQPIGRVAYSVSYKINIS